MNRRRSLREEGSSLVFILLVLTVLLGLAAVLCLTAVQGVRAASASDQWGRSFYLADSGAQ